MKLKYYIKYHMGTPRMYLKDKDQRMWLTKLTKHATVTEVDKQALEGLGIKLVEVKEK